MCAVRRPTRWHAACEVSVARNKTVDPSRSPAASVVDPFGNLGVIYNPHYVEVLATR